jgi:hypothetical protein
MHMYIAARVQTQPVIQAQASKIRTNTQENLCFSHYYLVHAVEHSMHQVIV